MTEAFSPAIGEIDSAPLQAVASAALGGTASKLAGGSFSNGAVTAAFAYLFNQAIHKERQLSQDQRLSRAKTIKGYLEWIDSMSDDELYVAFPGLEDRFVPGDRERNADLWRQAIRNELIPVWSQDTGSYLAQSYADGLNEAMSAPLVGYGLGRVSEFASRGWTIYSRTDTFWDSFKGFFGVRLPETRISCSPSEGSCVYFTGQ